MGFNIGTVGYQLQELVRNCRRSCEPGLHQRQACTAHGDKCMHCTYVEE